MKKKIVLLVFLLFSVIVFPVNVLGNELNGLEKISTSELVETILDSNIFQEIKLYSDDYLGMNNVIRTSNIGEKLIYREDADSVLYDKYISQYDGYYQKEVNNKIYKLELLLRIPECNDGLSSEQRTFLTNVVQSK